METSDNMTKITDAAIEVFSKKGYKETKITDIADRARVSVGTIYVNFKGKKELFQSLNIPELEQYRPEFGKRRNKILKTALSVFRQNGYSAASMSKIASECGFTKAVLYQYFNSKEELFRALFHESTMTSNLDNLIIEHTNQNLEEVLVKIGYTFMEVFEDEDRLNLIRIVISESLRFPQLGKSMYVNAINMVAEKFASYLQMLSEMGKIECINPKLTARSYFGLLYSFIITDKILNPENKEFSVDEIIGHAAQLFLNSLKTEK